MDAPLSQYGSPRGGTLLKTGARWLLYALGLLFLLLRAKYGFCYDDEPFCVTLAQRLYMGDALIALEWHVCQLFSAVLLPFYALFRLFSPTNEGILLTFRYCYCLIWWLCSLRVAAALGRRDRERITVFLFLLPFAPLDYMTLSYTSLGLTAALLLCCILYKLPEAGRGTALAFSLLWAVLVLCSPLMLLGYLGLLAVAFWGCRREKKRGEKGYFTALTGLFRYALPIDLGLGAAFVVFFILSRAELSTVLDSIPYMLSDPEHQSGGVLYTLLILVYGVLRSSPLYITVCFTVFLWGLLRRPRRRLPLLALCAALYVRSQIRAAGLPFAFNIQMLHIVFLGAVAYALLEHRDRKLFRCFYVPSAVYTVLQFLSSNTRLMSVSMTATVAGCAALIFLIRLGGELAEQYRPSKALRAAAAVLVCGCLCLQLSSELYVKLTRQYWDAPPYRMDTRIGCGAARGLVTTRENAEAYEEKYEALTYLLGQVDTEGKSFLSLTMGPYLYLDADLEFATFSAWTKGYGDSLADRLRSYQSFGPERIPDLIYHAPGDGLPDLPEGGYMLLEYEGHCLFVRK